MDNRKRYKIICPYCMEVQYACKSIAQSMGIDAGHGTCIYCKRLMKLTFDYDQDAMTTEKWEEK